MALKTFPKQPAERQDYDISFVDWLNSLTDTIATVTVVADTGITLETNFSHSAGIVKCWLLGGADGTIYTVTATVTTTGGRVKQAEIRIKVKETR